MKAQSIGVSDSLDLVDAGGDDGVSVVAARDVAEGEVVASIPKRACLTVRTCAASEVIEAAGIAGQLGLSAALMHERGLGEASEWYGYLQMLPRRAYVPLTWTVGEVDELLKGTELQKIVKEDKIHLHEDWKECILPLIASDPSKFNLKNSGIEQYFDAKSLVASRAFEIDDYHGYGMVPLADLFNHKTGAEDVHFTSVCSHSDSESCEDGDTGAGCEDGETGTGCEGETGAVYDGVDDEETSNTNISMCSSDSTDDPTVLQMLMVKDVKVGSEVFNTYGSIGNAALLHRYGFAEPDNPFDIVNIDLNLVLQRVSSSVSPRQVRARHSLWRKLDFSGCVSQNSEYFEISSTGVPQLELLVLLYMFFLPEKQYEQLNHTNLSLDEPDEALKAVLSTKIDTKSHPLTLKVANECLLSDDVRCMLVSLVDDRERLYGSDSLEDDVKLLNGCCRVRERKRYYALLLRICERKILEKLRVFASDGYNAKGKL
ncbi:hypothetical protein QJS10_CPB13g00894 [Acorus calamus]|uniref:N-lysine methyltransferase n=1 Tax=Acorus calamus TaxID=4465 RepID=A0AAV9DHV1_ACOCL|nr:hypothetical protein QJS10_CPB13g00894 [Acorus calamus]